MDTLSSFLVGLGLATQPENLLFALAGCVIGTLVGVLPGVGPVAGIAILLPVTFGMPASGALIMLSAIYYGTMYGGTITSVLMNVPGESASVVTAIEGHQMAKQGRAGAALAIAAIGSFVGGCIATVFIIFLARPLSVFGLHVGPPEFFALILVSFTLLIGLAGDSPIKGLISALFGLALTLPGLDPMSGFPRMTFDSPLMLQGFGLVPVLMGLFGISEIMLNIEGKQQSVLSAPISSLFLKLQDWKDSFWPIVRGTGIGFMVGLVPGLGAVTSSFISYSVERWASRHPEQFGKGAIAGVAGPETANNATANAALLPLLTLGIPGSAAAALILGGFLIQGIVPGPFLFRDHSDLVWTLIASMIVANFILLILNLPLVGCWARLLLVPYPILFTLILVFTIVGTYSINGSLFDVAVMLVFGGIGYVIRKLEFPLAPLALTLVLGPAFEQTLRQSLLLSKGDFTIFVRGPIATTLMIVAALVLVFSFVPVSKALRTLRGSDTEI